MPLTNIPEPHHMKDPASSNADHQAADRPDLLVTGLRGYTDTGIIGSPSLATAAKGRAVLDSLTASFADHLKVLDH